MAVNESGLLNYPSPVFIDQEEKILAQMKGSVCKINGEKATGFFCKIPIDKSLIPVFITNNHVINGDYLKKNDEIKITVYKNKAPNSIKLNNKIIYTNETYDVTIIEINENKDGVYDYLDLDDNILDETGIDNYKGNSIYVLQYPNYYGIQKLAVSYGILKYRGVDKKYNFAHYCSTEYGSSGSPILNMINNKVIGIHKQRYDNKYNIGSFLYYSIIGFINVYKNNCHVKEFNDKFVGEMRNIGIGDYNNNIYSNNNNKNYPLKSQIQELNYYQNENIQLKTQLQELNSYKNKFNQLQINKAKNEEIINELKIKNENLISQINEIKRTYICKEKKKVLEVEIEKLKRIIKDLTDQINVLKIEKNTDPILVGLDNIGAPDIMNATLQCLSNTTQLTDFFLKSSITKKMLKKNSISNEYYKLLTNLWDRKNNKKSYAPHSFKELLGKENSLFAIKCASDLRDLIDFLLERFHKELNLIDFNNLQKNNIIIKQQDQFDEKKMLNLFVDDFKVEYHSIISDLFYGVMEGKTKCLECNNIKYNFQVYSFIEFPLELVNDYCIKNGLKTNNTTNPDINIYECFKYYEKEDLMKGDNQMYCNICKKCCDALYSYNILYSLPNLLIIILKRGKNAFYKGKVNFPEKLNLLNFVTFQNGNTYFELYAVISVIETSSTSHHFVAYCKNKIDKKWYKYDDSLVELCQQKNEFLNGMPHVLFYQAI